MPNPKLVYWRNKNNGGQFNGEVYVDTGRVVVSPYYPKRYRFQIGEFSSGFEYIGSVGTKISNDNYSLMVVRDANDYYLRVGYLGVDYDFVGERLIGGSKIYNIEVEITASLVKIYYMEELSSRQYAGLQIQNTSLEGSYSVLAGRFTLGATRSSLYSVSSDNRFTGRIFDYDASHNSTGADRQRLTFYKNYNGVNDYTIADYYGGNNGILYSSHDAFWPEELDLSSYIGEDNPPTMTYREDFMRVREYGETEFKLFNYFGIYAGDTVAIKIDDEIRNLYRVDEVSVVGEGHYVLVKCYDFMKDLEKCSSFSYSYNKLTGYYRQDAKWWVNKEDPDDKCTVDGLNLNYLLELAIYILQYDNILSVNMGEIEANTKSPYKDYTTGDELNYEDLGFNWYMFRDINKSVYNNFDEASLMDEIFTEILLSARITYYVANGYLVFSPIEKGNVDFIESDVWQSSPKIPETFRKNFEVETDILLEDEAEIPWLDEYEEQWDTSDINTVYKNGIDVVRNKYESENMELITLLPHFWIMRWTSSGVNCFRNSDDDQNFIKQLADTLQKELRGTVNYKILTVNILQEFSPKFRERYDYPAEQRSEIKQEIS